MHNPGVDPNLRSGTHSTEDVNAGHAAWERIREAFRRDWQQTKFNHSARTHEGLNQHSADTLLQAAGMQPIPPSDRKTHPDTLAQDKAAAARAVMTLNRTTVIMDAANAGISREVVRGADAEDRTPPRDPTRSEENFTGMGPPAELLDAKNRITEYRRTFRAAEAERDAAAATWLRVEPAARFGFTARARLKVAGRWSPLVEERLRAEWNAGHVDASWEESREDVRSGWLWSELVDRKVPAP